MKVRDRLKEKKRIVVKIGSSSLTHEETGRLVLFTDNIRNPLRQKNKCVSFCQVLQ